MRSHRGTTVEKIAFFGGLYSNYLALEAAIRDARRRGVDAMYCLGDFGAFGPHPNRTVELLRDNEIACIQGNYDHSLAEGLDDCQCGYTDPRDNHFARLSYEYTFENTAPEHRAWMGTLPSRRRIELGSYRLLLCHGSPGRVNEFLWESTSSTHFLDKMATDYGADVILGTHTGIRWQRELSAGRRFVNVGALGRPENDGRTNVWYTVLSCASSSPGQDACLSIEFIPVNYNHHRLAREMAKEGLPTEFIETIRTGWWTTCLEVLPSKERRRGRF